MGKAKHNRAALAQQGGFSAEIKPHTPAAPQLDKPPAASKECLGGVRWDRIGAVVAVQRDYLDMKDIPEENGLKHCGYLVLLRGEEIKLLYVGTEQAGDAEWLFGEVLRSLSSEPRGRRGWLPRSVVQPPPASTAPGPIANRMEAGKSGQSGPGPPQASVDPDGFTVVGQGRRSPGTAASAAAPTAGGIARGALQPSQQLAASPDRASAKAVAKATAKTAAKASASSRAATRTQGRSSQSARGQAAVLSNDTAFPALPGHSGVAPWEGEDDSADEEEEQVEEVKVEKERDVAGMIARQRAAAAKAAAEAQAAEKRKVKAAAGSKGGEAACPICMQTFNTQRRQITRLCCGTVLCAKCDQKSLQSRRCFFCREEEPEFPSLQRVK